jgi:hypothetical protein
VTLIEGPAIHVPYLPPPRTPSPAGLALLAGACLLVLIVVGSGWAVTLTDLSPVGTVSVSPAFGLAALGLFGTIASRLGVPLRGASAIVIVAGSMAAGWVPVAARRLRRSIPDDSEGGTPSAPSQR